MKIKKELYIAGETECAVYKAGESPKALIIQPADKNEFEELDRQIESEVEMAGTSFVHVAFEIKNWNKDLSPWEAPAVFGKDGFGSGAEQTLDFIKKGIWPNVISDRLVEPKVPVIIGGYSLAGLFALWCSYQTNKFKAVAAASPSVWFPHWIEFASENRMQADHVYLSLGDKEARTKNAVMATVSDCIIKQQRLLTESGIDNTLEWNSGNHFTESVLRCAKAFSWCLGSIVSGCTGRYES